MRPNLPLLVDANIVIEAHKLSVWGPLIGQLRVAVPSIVIDQEARFFFSSAAGGIPTEIKLSLLVAAGTVERVEATQEEMKAVTDAFDRVFIEGVHEGEHEALAIIMHRPDQYHFCSADAVAIRALAMIERGHAGISLERILDSIGLRKHLAKQFTEDFFREVLGQGNVQRIQGVGLKKRTIP